VPATLLAQAREIRTPPLASILLRLCRGVFALVDPSPDNDDIGFLLADDALRGVVLLSQSISAFLDLHPRREVQKLSPAPAGISRTTATSTEEGEETNTLLASSSSIPAAAPSLPIEMNPTTKSLLSLAIFTAAAVYSPSTGISQSIIGKRKVKQTPLARLPLEDISASTRHARPFLLPTSARPWMTPGPFVVVVVVVVDVLIEH
jgi:hypothetical protein